MIKYLLEYKNFEIDEVQKLHYYKIRGAIMIGELKKTRIEKK